VWFLTEQEEMDLSKLIQELTARWKQIGERPR
jgi:hypothetical protein